MYLLKPYNGNICPVLSLLALGQVEIDFAAAE
jgi:hypothetical protein